MCVCVCVYAGGEGIKRMENSTERDGDKMESGGKHGEAKAS